VAGGETPNPLPGTVSSVGRIYRGVSRCALSRAKIIFAPLTFWRLNVFYIQYKNSVRTSRETHYVSATNINL
jgi:hypothetical protein